MNESKTLIPDWKSSKEEVEKAIFDARNAHEKYRSSGLGLTALIVTLSGASSYQLRNVSVYSAVFAIPIILSLMHQTAHFLGSMYFAKCLFHSAANAAYSIRGQSDLMSHHAGESSKQWDRANKCFSFSEYLCLSAALAFCFFLLTTVWFLVDRSTAWVLTSVLLVLVFLCWKYRDRDLISKFL